MVGEGNSLSGCVFTSNMSTPQLLFKLAKPHFKTEIARAPHQPSLLEDLILFDSNTAAQSPNPGDFLFKASKTSSSTRLAGITHITPLKINHLFLIFRGYFHRNQKTLLDSDFSIRNCNVTTEFVERESDSTSSNHLGRKMKGESELVKVRRQKELGRKCQNAAV